MMDGYAKLALASQRDILKGGFNLALEILLMDGIVTSPDPDNLNRRFNLALEILLMDGIRRNTSPDLKYRVVSISLSRFF